MSDPATAAAEPQSAAPPVHVQEAPARRRSWLYEGPLFYLALVAFQRLAFPGHPGWHGVEPNPAWIGVLLFGLRYGLVAGACAGLASAALDVWGVRSAGEAFRLSDADYWVEPGLFVVLGAAVGAAADAYMHRISDLNRRLADLDERNQGLKEQVLSQQKAMRAVEQQVVSQMSSVVTLYHGSRRLGTLERSELFEAIMDFFTRALQATKTGLYVPEDGTWVLKGERGWAKDDPYPRSVAFGAGIVGRAGAEKRSASLRDWLVGSFETGAAMPDKSDAIMAAPIMGPDDRPAAVFAVQAMPFLRFNSASLNLLTLLSDWGAEAYAKCLGVEDLRARSVLDEEYGVHSAGYFASRLGQEFARSRRYALPFSILLVVPAATPPEKRPHYLRALCRVLRESVREMDIVARSGDPDVPFAALVVTATREQAAEVRLRALSAYAKAGLPEGLRLGLGSYSHSMKDPKEVLDQARAEFD